MKDPIIRTVIFHGAYSEKYIDTIQIGADSMFTLCSILFKEVFPDLLNEEGLTLVLEGDDGVKTDLFDPDQILLSDQTTIHIIPNPDGSIPQLVLAIIVMIVSVGIAMLLAPKPELQEASGSGSVFDSIDNVIGQGGVIPVALGRRLHGSRVVSAGIDSIMYIGRGNTYG